MYKLVIVDDEYYTLEGMKKIIDWGKYNIEIVGTATDGTDGLQLIRETNPDIVIADVRMQEMDGIEMIEYLRKGNYNGKIIILSGYSSFEYAQRAIDFKVEKYLTKPINCEKLEETICSIVKDMDKNVMENNKQLMPEILKNVLEYIDKNYTTEISLSMLAKDFYTTTTVLSKLFRKYMGINYMEYVTQKRMDKAKELLVYSDEPVENIMFKVGYKDAKHFRAVFKRMEGISPRDYRRENIIKNER